jgi:hypothetical protein
MKTIDRKAAVAAYKERKTPAGIFAIRCLSTGQVWVGQSQHLDTQQNGIWFTLKHGSSTNRELQAAWNKFGEAAFTFEALERLPDETLSYVRQSILKERLLAWRNSLNAALA